MALSDQHIGMQARLRFVEAILQTEKEALDSQHRAVTLALWRGESSETKERSNEIEMRSQLVKKWTDARNLVAEAAKADPTAPKDDSSGCVVQ